MRYLSLCSGIEAATVAWSSLGWKAAAFAEVESFPSAVLAFHYPDVPNLGDMTKINGKDYRGLVNVLVGGTPCQSFSVAGLRRGLEDERGNLALEFVRLADECDPAFVVWENVPGVLSDRGNAFGCFCAALCGEDAPLLPPGGKWSDAGYVLGPRRAIAWRILDAQYFGLAQRRRRVFLVACLRDGADPRKILFEFDGMRRDFAPGRETGTDVAGTLDASFGRSRGAGQNPSAITQALTGRLGGGGPDDNKAQGGFYVAGIAPTLRAGGNNTGGDRPVGTDVDTCESLVGYVPEIVSQGIPCKWSKGTSGPAGDEHHNLVANTLRAEGFDASEDGTGRQNLVVAPPLKGNQYGDHESREGLLVPMQSPGSVLVFHGSQDPSVSGDVTHPCGRNGGRETCVMAFTERGRKEGRTLEAQPDLAYALTNPGSGGRTHSRQILDVRPSVRRLTPRECERLQGFPDDYTAIPYRQPFGNLPKPILERSYQRYLRRMARKGKEPFQLDDLIKCADGPRYKALGNSMAVPVMRWIGQRIQQLEAAHV